MTNKKNSIEYIDNDKEVYDEYIGCISVVMNNLIKQLCIVADEYNIERDDVMKHFSKLLSTMAKVSTISGFGV